jgi:hypothetical protein
MVLRSVWAIGALCATVLAASPALAEEPEEKPRRNVIRPEETNGLPPGFHEESRVRWGAIIGGGTVTLVGTAFVVAGIVEKAEEAQRDRYAPSPDADPGFSRAQVLLFLWWAASDCRHPAPHVRAHRSAHGVRARSADGGRGERERRTHGRDGERARSVLSAGRRGPAAEASFTDTVGASKGGRSLLTWAT